MPPALPTHNSPTRCPPVSSAGRSQWTAEKLFSHSPRHTKVHARPLRAASALPYVQVRPPAANPTSPTRAVSRGAASSAATAMLAASADAAAAAASAFARASLAAPSPRAHDPRRGRPRHRRSLSRLSPRHHRLCPRRRHHDCHCVAATRAAPRLLRRDRHPGRLGRRRRLSFRACVDRRPLRRDSIRPIQTATALFGSSGALVWGLFCVKIICIKSKSVLLDERGGWCHKVDGDGDADADTLTVTVMVNSSSKIQLIRP